MLEQSGMKREIDFFDLDLTYMYKTYRFRVNISQNEVGYAVSMRKVNLLIPKPEEIGVGKDLLKYLHNDQGLILITG
jgi:Tfp pilus assembly pilus retraction ATPase PilT